MELKSIKTKAWETSIRMRMEQTKYMPFKIIQTSKRQEADKTRQRKMGKKETLPKKNTEEQTRKKECRRKQMKIPTR